MHLNRKTCLFPGLMLMGSSIFVLMYNHWLFVNLAMAFVIIFGFLVYFLALHTHTYSRDSMLIFLGRAYIGIALITLLHLLGLIPAGNPLLIPTGGRLIEALALFVAPLFERCQTRSWFMKMGTILLGAAVFLVSWSGWPLLQASPGFLFNASGLIDYLVIIMLFMAIPHILNRARLKEHPAYYLLLSVVGVLVLSELSLIVLGTGSTIGLELFYWLRLLAYYIMLFVLLARGIREPYEQLDHAYKETLDAWGKALEMRDWETEGHCQRVAELTVRVAVVCGIRGSYLINMYRGALLHDIGKLAVPDQVLLKEGELTPEEWQLMRSHPDHAVRLLGNIAFLHSAIEIPAYHHEKWDGSGYPQGLRGEEIPLAARIFALVDVWDALSHNRPYRQAWEAEKIFNWMKQQAGSHFDPALIPIFIDYVGASHSK